MRTRAAVQQAPALCSHRRDVGPLQSMRGRLRNIAPTTIMLHAALNIRTSICYVVRMQPIMSTLG